MKLPEAFKYLLSPLLSMWWPLKKAFSGENPHISSFLPNWQVKTSKKQDKCIPPSKTQFFNSVLMLATWGHFSPMQCLSSAFILSSALSSTTQPIVLTAAQQWGGAARQGVLLLAAPGVTMLCDPDFPSQRDTRVCDRACEGQVQHLQLHFPLPRKKGKKTNVPLFYSPTLQESTFPVENNLKICTRVVWFGHQDPDFNVSNATLKEIYPYLTQLPKRIIKKATTVKFPGISTAWSATGVKFLQ